MAHMIEADDYTVFAEGGATPWTGLAHKVGANLTPEEIRAAAHLDYRVLDYKLALESQKVPGTFKSIPATEFKALVRSTDGKLLDITNGEYHTHQTSDICDLVKNVFDAGGMTMETAGSLQGGRVIWFLGKLDAEFTLPGTNDKTSMYTLFSTGFKRGFASQVDLTTIRAVCWNTVMATRGCKGKGGEGEKYGRYRLTHAAKWSELHAQNARNIAEDGRKALEVYRVQAERLNSAKWDSEITRAYCCELLAPEFFKAALDQTEFKGLKSIADAPQHNWSLDEVLQRSSVYLGSDFITVGDTKVKPARMVEKVIERIDTQPGADHSGSAWQAFNAVTNVVDYKGRNRDSGLTSAWYGQGATLKANALELALNYTEAIYQ